MDDDDMIHNMMFIEKREGVAEDLLHSGAHSTTRKEAL
jgi:hypothetical protein